MTEERPGGIDELEALTKRFKDYIDRIQAAFDRPLDPVRENRSDDISGEIPSKKLYTVVSPIDAMTSSMKSVLSALDKAIGNIDLLSAGETLKSDFDTRQTKQQDRNDAVVSTEPKHEKFTEEELDFLVKTFNSILNSSEEERKKIFTRLEKKESS